MTDHYERKDADSARDEMILRIKASDWLRIKASDWEALQQRVRELEEALGEISRRTGLLIHQNTGRWDTRLEHDRRTVDVLTVNQRIARKALGDTHE